MEGGFISSKICYFDQLQADSYLCHDWSTFKSSRIYGSCVISPERSWRFSLHRFLSLLHRFGAVILSRWTHTFARRRSGLKLFCLCVCVVFAYGATGAGKTHTMLGSSENPGVMYLTMKELFNRMDLIKEEKVFDIAFSYLEVIGALRAYSFIISRSCSAFYLFIIVFLICYC